jgi:ribonuclease BN (tRNA processing enzyme)
LLTHLHGDHFAGLPFLLIDGIFREVRGPLTIAGPIGVEDRVRTLSRTCYPDIFTDTLPFELHFIEWQDDVEVTVDGRRVLPVPAIHQDLPERAYSLRITRPGGRRLAFTGDTGWSERLPALLDGADLFVAECSQWDDAYDRHLGRADWARLLPFLAGKRVAVAHLGEEALAHRAELAQLAVAAGVDLTVAEDGLRLEL